MRRILYLGYYLKNLDWKKFRDFLYFVNRNHGLSRVRIILDVILSSLRYNISILEYFQFRFYIIGREQRKTYAGTGFMYEYQLIMNPRRHRHILDDKTKFYRSYSRFIKHKIADLKDLNADPNLNRVLLEPQNGKIVLKVFNGKCGEQVLIKNSNELSNIGLIQFMKDNNFDLAEEFIVQHAALMQLSPTAVNTVRIFTQLNVDNKVEILGCRLRISVNSSVDNMAAGNIAAPIDELSGVVNGPGVYSDIAKSDVSLHPVTGVAITGFMIPFWGDTINMVKEAALLHPQNRSIGWDIAITANGPDLIEGNHDWCKLVWQLPVKQGLKPVLDKHLREYKQNEI